MGAGATTAANATAKETALAVVASSSRSDIGSCFAGLPSRSRAKLLKAVDDAMLFDAAEAQAVADDQQENAKDVGADRLAGKGFTVEQLLRFYVAYTAMGINRRTTNSVVAQIIIPETTDPPRCYMESAFMQSWGGGHVAKKLVSHAWKSEFLNTMLNILLDATGRPKRDFIQYGAWEQGREPVYSHAKCTLDADFLLDVLPPATLQKTYWLCIFAVDEHHAICGDCWECNRKEAWRADPIKHLKAGICLLCGKPKFNPCTCGSVKFAPGDPRYEIDLFDRIVSKMDALVVSLDCDLNSIKRVWVVAEIGKAIQLSTVIFRLCNGLGADAVCNLTEGRDLMPSVEACDATSNDDKERILDEIRALEGGTVAYDQFINCMLELSFGICSRLRSLQGAAANTLAKLHHLEMDFTWRKNELYVLEDCCSYFRELRTFLLDCSSCGSLKSIDEFGKGLGHCQALTSAIFNFRLCSSLESIDELGKGLGQCQALASVTLAFQCCSFESIDELGKGLGHCQALTSANFDFPYCSSLKSIDEIGKGLGHCQALASSTFRFIRGSGSTLDSIDDFGQGLGQCQALASATFDFGGCSSLESIDEFGKGLGQCKALTSATFNFHCCESLNSIDEFGRGMGHCQALASATFKFSCLRLLKSIDEFGKGLGQCQTLTSATFDFEDCSSLESIDEFGKGLGHCQALASATFAFPYCSSLKSIDEFGKVLGHCQALASATFAFNSCYSLKSIDEFGKGLGQCQSLTSATFDFACCSSLESIDEFGKGLGHCQALASATFMLRSLSLESIDEFGKGLGHCQALTSATFDFFDCECLKSIDEFGKGLGHCKALTSASFIFEGCSSLKSIDEFGKGLGHCQSLTSAKGSFDSSVWAIASDESKRIFG